MGRVPSPPSGSEDEDDLDQSPPAKLSRYIGWARNSIFIVLCPLVWGVICYPITSSTRSDTNASLSHQIMLLLLLSFTKPHPTLCDPCTTAPGLPVLHCLPEFSQVHVHWVADAIQPSHPLSTPSPPAFTLSQNRDLFQWVGSLHQGAKVLELQLYYQIMTYWIGNMLYFQGVCSTRNPAVYYRCRHNF